VYIQYSKQGKAAVIPGLGFRGEIILPPSQMRWLFTQPDEALNVAHAFADIDQVQYSLGSEKYIIDAWQGELVKTQLNVVLESICAAMNDELAFAFDSRLGKDTENWKDFDVFNTFRMIVAQAASRFTVGLPLCRNEEYLELSLAMGNNLVLLAGVIGALPRSLRPILGPLAAISMDLKTRRFKKLIAAEYKERLDFVLNNDANGPNERQDHFQMMLRFAQRQRQAELHDFDCIARRLAVTNFGSMHQTAFQVTNMVLNILGSNAEYNTVSILRDEAERVLGSSSSPGAPHDNKWTKAKVAKMVRADSAARETMRLNGFGGRSVFRKVLRDGVITPEGYELPKGSMVSFLSQPVQTDEKTFDDAMKYDPFRFSRMREEHAANVERGDEKAGAKAPNVSFVTTSPEHMAFGHGAHAW
jgi:cytochrome P450